MAEKADWIEALGGGSLELRRTTAERLAQSPEQVRWNPGSGVLVRAAADDDEVVREWAVAALESMGAPHQADAQELAQILASSHRDDAYWAASLLGRLGSRADLAVSPLAAALTSHPDPAVRQRAAWALGQMGSAARTAQAALQAAAQSADSRLARLANEALRQISVD